MEFVRNLLKKEFVMKIIVFGVIMAILFSLRNFANLFIITFLFTYMIGSLVELINKKIPIKREIIIVIMYVLIIGVVVRVAIKYSPLFIEQTREIVMKINELRFIKPTNIFEEMIQYVIKDIDFKKYFAPPENTFKAVKYVTGFGFNMIVSLMLSFFFLMEKKKTLDFLDKFKNSKVDWFYRYLRIFIDDFLQSFGKVIQAQLLVATANVTLSTIGLYIMGFPQLLALGVMIFVLSLIPVAGVIISLVPLLLIAYNIGGFIKVIYVIVMIFAIHGFESYFLNPKFMSDKTELPVFFTFLILILSEHLLGMWGLLLGIPLFIFILNLLDVRFEKKKIRKTKDIKAIVKD
ncbi:MAG: AI-2E family transporter [Clostridiaceae bacterium]